MATPLLQTKLYIPPLRPELVPRPRLIERLNDGLSLGAKLTLVSAPAGSGKTTLLSEWVAGCGLRTRVAWVSLDEDDNDLPRFLTYVVDALQQVDAHLGEACQASLQAPLPPPVEPLITALINDVAAYDGRLVLILDDYHPITATPRGRRSSVAGDTRGGVFSARSYAPPTAPRHRHPG